MPRFQIDPVPKPRMTQSDKWRERPAVMRYWAFKDELQRQANEQGFTLPDRFGVIFYLPMPLSWSKRKRSQMLGKPHQQKPDNSNLLKALEDVLLPDDDSRIWFTIIKKVWALEGAIIIYPDMQVEF